MSTISNPVGPQPPKVYWRRRLMVLLGLVAIIVVVVLIIVRPGSGNEDAPPTGASASPSASPDAEADAAADDAGADDDGMCRPQNVTIEAIADSNAYAAGVNPQIGMRLTNIGSAPCILDVTPSRQVYEIGSGEEAYWLSTDCQAEAAEAMVTLEPNAPQSTTPIPWDRTRSTPCDSSTQPVPAGDATYYLQVRLGEELESERVTFRLL